VDAKLMEAQRQRRLFQLSHLEDLVYSLTGNAEYDVFEEGAEDHKSVMKFSKQLPESMPLNVPFERSGSTGVVVLITPSHILCANAGDSGAILSKKSGESSTGDVLPLSFDHNPNNDVELCHVEKDGGFVRTKRVDGGLAVSRGFGDFKYKNCARDVSSDESSSGSSYASTNSSQKDHRVTVHPEIIVHTREQNDDEFVVLACDGISGIGFRTETARTWSVTWCAARARRTRASSARKLPTLRLRWTAATI
jgi:serine/threonine protein phosphatase PrpC